jgi:beta-glucosidase/6-phospho-beta-glucosidase/beta-galactosidase
VLCANISQYPVGYFTEVSVPPSLQQYFCSHHALLAHAKAYHVAKSLGIKGTIAIKNNGGYKIPLTDSSDDALATQRAWDFNEGRFSGPAYVNGDYPSTYKTFASSIGLEFTEEQKALINSTGDIYAHDAYTSSFYYAPDVGVSACVSDPTNTLYPGCFNSTNVGPTGWLIGAASDQYSTWLNSATDWVPAFLHYIQKTWPSGGIVVSEFGFSEPYEELRTSLPDIVSDPIRSMYYRDYMKGILMAISEGVNVVGSIAWAITDNLEWASGEYLSAFQYL